MNELYDKIEELNLRLIKLTAMVKSLLEKEGA